tara:strand:+ start:791 stop:2011 length:1221 start_codon:yes stop_codon:yes gene_type:complete
MNEISKFESVLKPQKSKAIEFDGIKDLFNQIYSSDEQKKIKSFIRDLLKILDVHDFENTKFIYSDNKFDCWLGESCLFSINQDGLHLVIESIPLNKEFKDNLSRILSGTKQKSNLLDTVFGSSNIFKIYCHPKYIDDLSSEILKGFSYLVDEQMDIQFQPIEDEHDIDFLKFFALEFLLIQENNEREPYSDEDLLMGENSNLEYKPNIFQQRRNTSNESENEILRTVNGFMNSNGGTLIVGLHDSKKDEYGLNIVREDFLNEYYEKDFDKYLLRIRSLFESAFDLVSMELITIDRINMGPGLIFSNGKEIFSEDNRFILRIDIEQSNKPVFVNLKREECKQHECPNCDQTLIGKKQHFIQNVSAFFVRSPSSSTEQYSFDKVIEHISKRNPKYFNFIANNYSENEQ